ncbi:MAG: YigZ family protein [Tidjanibacter sp.]|nr:YigZ family protein [Tidjanibacter sp.]MBQ5807811.1 YigZ family protein [Tidjanibacter sp.]MBQ5931005.1 YigZ family protein [Tidjanibacter sp.]
MAEQKDTYLTIVGQSETIIRERSSKFLSLAYHVRTAEEVKEIMDGLRKKHYDATHHCYAYRLGPRGEEFRANDDGEPSGTAGKPILGQLLSRDITDILVVVIRWFGGTKLGVSGLIETYRESTAAVLDVCKVEERTIDRIYHIRYPFESMDGVMRAVKAVGPKIVEQTFDNMCSMRLAVRLSLADQLYGRLEKIEGINIEDETEV